MYLHLIVTITAHELRSQTIISISTTVNLEKCGFDKNQMANETLTVNPRYFGTFIAFRTLRNHGIR
jgi:hypothetical protein